jgi:hypothetical protein
MLKALALDLRSNNAVLSKQITSGRQVTKAHIKKYFGSLVRLKGEEHDKQNVSNIRSLISF